MNKTTKIAEITLHLEEGDYDLGFRKLLDLVKDSDHIPFFWEAIEITKWKNESENYNEEEFISQCQDLLSKLESYPINEVAGVNHVLVGQNLVKNFGKNNFTLGPIDISLKPREVVGLVGENGNGKTTLLTILAQELAKSSGSLDYEFSVPYNTNYELRTRLAYVPQRTQKWYGPLKDNLKFVLACYNTPADEIEPRMLLMIARLGLWNYQDLDWEELSSGYKMRFELARTLFRKPEILLLDEPLANLDVLAQQVILDDLKLIANSLSKPIALVLSSQQLYEVEKVSNKVIYLKNGKTLSKQEESYYNDQFIIELDTQESKKTLEETFKSLNINEIQYNGGIYVLYFPKDTRLSDIFKLIGEKELNIINLRNISESTRRYFV